MEALLEFGKIIIPAAIVLYAMYLVVNSFLQKEFEKRLIDIKLKNTDVVLPIRLQAYERLSLFLERISPNNLVLRLNNSGYSAKQFQQILQNEVREEYNHNLSQQVYVGDEVWDFVKNAKEDVITVINKAAEKVTEESKSIDLAKAIFELMMQKQSDPITVALGKLKEEIRVMF